MNAADCSLSACGKKEHRFYNLNVRVAIDVHGLVVDGTKRPCEEGSESEERTRHDLHVNEGSVGHVAYMAPRWACRMAQVNCMQALKAVMRQCTPRPACPVRAHMYRILSTFRILSLDELMSSSCTCSPSAPIDGRTKRVHVVEQDTRSEHVAHGNHEASNLLRHATAEEPPGATRADRPIINLVWV
jgi:hypothetical protein